MEILKLTEKAGSKEVIMGAIDSLTQENCIKVFCDYLACKRGTSLTDFERGYVSELDNRLYSLAKEVLRLQYNKHSREALLEVVVDWGISSPYSFECCCDNEEIEEFLQNAGISREEKLTVVIEFMRETLDIYCEKIQKTYREKELKAIESSLKDYQKSIAHYEEKIAELEEKLKKLQ